MRQLVLLPKAEKSNSAKRGNIESYTLLINGYLLDGSFKEKNQNYPSICTEFMNTGSYDGEPLESKILRKNVEEIYNTYKDKLGKSNISFKVQSSSRLKFRIKKYFEMINTAIILNEFLKDKSINCEVAIYGNILKKEREFVIRPSNKKRWQ